MQIQRTPAFKGTSVFLKTNDIVLPEKQVEKITKAINKKTEADTSIIWGVKTCEGNQKRIIANVLFPGVKPTGKTLAKKLHGPENNPEIYVSTLTAIDIFAHTNQDKNFIDIDTGKNIYSSVRSKDRK
jgi:hypothetical protein